MTETDGVVRTAFDLPVEVVTWTVHGLRGPMAGPEYGTLQLARAFKATLWRLGCRVAMNGGIACASRRRGKTTKRLGCDEPSRCEANVLLPLDGTLMPHLPARVGVRIRRMRGSEDAQVRLDLRGRRAIALRALVEEGLALTLGGGPSGGVHVERTTARRRAQQWLSADAQSIVLRASTPWVLKKLAPSQEFDGDDAYDAARRFEKRFAEHAAQRLYKYASLGLADGRSSANPEEQHAISLMLRDAARAALSTPTIGWRGAHVATEPARHSGTGDGSFRVVAVEGAVEAHRPTLEQAAWLAALEILGGGEMTSEGYGCLEYLPRTLRRRQTA